MAKLNFKRPFLSLQCHDTSEIILIWWFGPH